MKYKKYISCFLILVNQFIYQVMNKLNLQDKMR